MLRGFVEGQKSLTSFSHRPSSSVYIIDGTRLSRKETLPNLTTLDTTAAIIRELAQVDWSPGKASDDSNTFQKTQGKKMN